jgi:2-(1,2-epoxy-1,2-dihydrophenyl)acetyl-CoA isomerase
MAPPLDRGIASLSVLPWASPCRVFFGFDRNDQPEGAFLMLAVDDFTTIALSVDTSGIARLELRRAEHANAMDLTMAYELRHAAVALLHDPNVRAVLISSSGAVFCGGGDLKAFAAESPAGVAAYIEHLTIDLHAAVARLTRLNAPVVAAVTGAVGGAGMSLVAACDLVVASSAAKFTMGYTRAGLVPDGTSSFFLSRAVGLRRAAELMLTNRTLTAPEALEWGLVNELAEPTEVTDRAEALVASLATGATGALGGAKRVLYEGAHSSLEEAMERESSVIGQVAALSDAREGISSFIEKRSPNFDGVR